MTLSVTNDSATVSTSEYSLLADTTSGVPTSQTADGYLTVYIHIASMAAADQFEIKFYETVNATQKEMIPAVLLIGAQAEPFSLGPVIVGNGYDVTVKKIAGTDRVVHWSWWLDTGGVTTDISTLATTTQVAALAADVSKIAVTSAALNTTAGSRTITSGSGSGGVANTTQADQTYDDMADSAGAIDFYYEFDISAIDGAVGVGVEWFGYLVGAVNTLKVYAYNWGGTAWEQLGAIIGIATTVESTQEYELTTAHTSAGLVRIRFAATGLTAATLKTDRLLLGYAVPPPTVEAIADEVVSRDVARWES